MEVRTSASPRDVKHYTSERLREEFLIQDVFAQSFVCGKLVDIVEETALFFRGQMHTVRHFRIAEVETSVKIRGFRGYLFQKIRINGQDDSFVGLFVNLRQIVTFKLINHEDISFPDIIEAVVNQKLLSPGDGIIDFITVMDMHIHGFFITVKM